jgi:Flp pilus assembly protein TadG
MPKSSLTLRNTDGQAMIEFALVLPILLLLVLGLIDIGQILLANHSVSQAARTGAHQAAINGGATETTYTGIRNVLDAGVGTDHESAEIEVVCTGSPCRKYDRINVRVTYHGSFWAPLPGFDTFAVRAEATRASERDHQ